LCRTQENEKCDQRRLSSPSPLNLRFEKSLMISNNTFNFEVLEKHVRAKIWEESINECIKFK